jgi:hypothetical protein
MKTRWNQSSSAQEKQEHILLGPCPVEASFVAHAAQTKATASGAHANFIMPRTGRPQDI